MFCKQWRQVFTRQKNLQKFLLINKKKFNLNYANKTAGKEARWQLHKNVESNIKQVLAATPHKAPTIRPPASHHENYPS